MCEHRDIHQTLDETNMQVYLDLSSRDFITGYLQLKLPHISNMGHYLELTKKCKTTDSRDKVFALLGLAGSAMKADYRLTFSEVCANAACDVSNMRRNWCILTSSWPPFGVSSECSWVPNFSIDIGKYVGMAENGCN